MGVWLQARSLYKMRDGVGGPMLAVGPDDPTYFKNLNPLEFAGSTDVFVVNAAPPPKNYKAPSYDEVSEKLKAKRLERQKEIAARTEAKMAKKKKAEAKAKAD